MLERAVGLACPRVNQRQIGNPVWTVERVPSNRLELDRALCLTDRLFFSAKPSVKYRNLREVRKILGFVALFGFPFLARGCKRGLRFLLIAARTRNLSVSPILIRILRRSSGNHPIRRVVIAQVKGGLKSCVPNPFARTILQRHLLKERLSRGWITLR